jgi:cytochrome P450
MPATLEFNPYDWKLHEDPYPTYRALRDRAPVYKNEQLGFFALSRHEDVLAALRDPVTFSSNEGPALERLDRTASEVASFLAMDPPRHDQMRGAVWHQFTRAAINRLEPTIRRLANQQLDEMPRSEVRDFIGEFSARLPMDVVSELLGVPPEDRQTLRVWADAVVHRDDYQSEVPPEAMVAGMSMLGYFVEHIGKRRAAGTVGDSITDVLLRAEVDGQPLGDGDLVPMHFLLGVAGGETTTKLLGNALYWLWKRPAERARLIADPSRIVGCVEETARFESSSQMVARTVTRDLELHGTAIPAGARVALLLGSANRDERVFPEPDNYDVCRKITQTLAFGHGVHYCLGAWLARLEGRVCLEEILRRFPAYEIVEDGMVRTHSPNVRGFSRLPIVLDPRRA